MKIILFNGPPGSGKDAAAAFTQRCLERDNLQVGVRKQKFAEPIKEAITEFFGMNGEQQRVFMETDMKNQPMDMLFGRSMREILISFSENWAKKEFGDDVFGKLAYDQLSAYADAYDYTIFSDSGFQSEFDYIYYRMNWFDIYVIKLTRPGCNYNSDSRGYIDPRNAHTAEIYNNDTLHDFDMAIRDMLLQFTLIK